MGFMTTINFLNDSYRQIETHPDEVIENILDAMNNTTQNMKTYGIGNFANPMEASKTEHADIPRLYMCWQNSFVEMGTRNDISDSLLDVRKKCLRQAKAIIKKEEETIKKIEGKTVVDFYDLPLRQNTRKQFGKYVVISKDNGTNYDVYENSVCAFSGCRKDVVVFINKQVPVKHKNMEE